MAQNEDKKRQARKRYIYERQSVPTIRLALGVSESSVRRWKRDAKAAGDDWDVARSATMLAGDGLESVVAAVVEDFVILFQATVEQIKSAENMDAGARVKLMASLSDAFNKMVASAGRVAPKISELGVANDVLQRMAAFVQENYPQHGEAFVEILEPFGEQLAGVYQ
jgi:hypothetical protein